MPLPAVDSRILDALIEGSLFLLDQRKEAAASGKYGAWKKYYFSRPAEFVNDCIFWDEGHGAAPYQERILAHLNTSGREAARGPHGLGKTALAAWAILHFALTRDGEDWKCVTTASAWRQLTRYLWPEIHKWARRLKWSVIGRPPFSPITELHQLSLDLNTGQAFAVASNNSDLIEGAHADHLLYVFDESKAIPDPTFDAAEGAFASGQCMALSISTPGEPIGRFYDIHRRALGYEDWAVDHVTLEECIASGQVKESWVDQRRRQWGENSAIYQNRVLGQFASSSEDSVIPLSWIEAANDRWYAFMETAEDKVKITKVGADIARSGDDKIVYANCQDDIVLSLERHSKQDTMVTTGQLANILKAHPGAYAVVDVLNMGSGVVDRLKELGYRVYPFNASEKSKKKDRAGIMGFINKRAEGWWRLREMLDPAYTPTLALPPDDLLTGDLTAPTWTTNSSGNIQVESKETIFDRLKRSTDDGDAVMMAYEPPPPRGQYLV